MFFSPSSSGTKESFGDEGSNLKDRIRSVLDDKDELTDAAEKNTETTEEKPSEEKIPKQEEEDGDAQSETGKAAAAADSKPDEEDQTKSRI